MDDDLRWLRSLLRTRAFGRVHEHHEVLGSTNDRAAEWIAEGAPRRVNGRMAASSAPGLGVTPRMDVLGKPVVVVE